jgi:DHA1 family tetracycline resistance protein-like MFS transporter
MSRDLRLVAISLLFWGFGEATWYYFEPLYLQHLGASPVQIGGIIGLSGLALTLTHIPAGYIADRFGRRQFMFAGWLLGLASALIMYLSRSLTAFTIGIVLYSFTGFVIAPLDSYVTNAREDWSVTRALTTIGAMYSLGAIFGPPIGGWVAKNSDLRSVFGVACIIFSISTGIILFTRPQPVEKHEPGGSYREVFTAAGLTRFLPLVFVSVFAMYLSWPLTPNFLQNERGMSVTQIGWFGALNGAGLVLLNLGLGRLNARRGVVIAQICVTASVVLIWLGAGAPWFAAGYLLAGAFRAAQSMLLAQAEGLVPPADLGLVYGMVETIYGFVIVLAAPIAGLLFGLHPGLPFPVSLILIALSLALTPWLSPRTIRAPVPMAITDLRRE